MGTLSKVANESTPSQWGYNSIVNRVAKHSFSCVTKLAFAEKENILYKVAKVIVALVSAIILVPLASVRALTSYAWNRIRGEKPATPAPAKTIPSPAAKVKPPAPQAAPKSAVKEQAPDFSGLDEAMDMPALVPAPRTPRPAPAPQNSAPRSPANQPAERIQETPVDVNAANASYGIRATGYAGIQDLFPYRNGAGAGPVTVSTVSDDMSSTETSDRSSIRSGKPAEDEEKAQPVKKKRGDKRSLCKADGDTLREMVAILGPDDETVQLYRDMAAGKKVELRPVPDKSQKGAPPAEAEPAAHEVNRDNMSPRERTEHKEKDPSWSGTAEEADFMMHKAPPPQADVAAVITMAKGMAKLPPKQVKQPDGPEIEADPANPGKYRAKRRGKNGSDGKPRTAKFNHVLGKYFVPGSPAELAALEAHRKQQEAGANA